MENIISDIPQKFQLLADRRPTGEATKGAPRKRVVQTKTADTVILWREQPGGCSTVRV